MNTRQTLWEVSIVALQQTDLKCLEIDFLISEINPLLWEIAKTCLATKRTEGSSDFLA